MTLEDLFRAPHSAYIGGTIYGLDFESQPLPPGLQFVYEEQPVSPIAIRNLLTHLLSTPEVVMGLVPFDWRDSIARTLLNQGLAGQARFMFTILKQVTGLAGPQAAAVVAEHIRNGDWRDFELVFITGLLIREQVLDALPILVQVFQDRRISLCYKPFLEESRGLLDAKRRELGISLHVWELLMIPEPEFTVERLPKSRKLYAKKLEDFMERGLKFTAPEVRLLADHTIHGENIKGLVFSVHDSNDKVKRTFVLPDPLQLDTNDAIAIAHPASLTQEEIAQWKATFASEKRSTPFDQWQRASVAKDREVTGLTANPADLLLHLESLGWRRGRADSGGVIRNHSKLFPDLDLTAVVRYAPGVPTTPGSRWTPQTIEVCQFHKESSGQQIEEPNPIAFSTVQQDLSALGAKQA